MFEHNGARIKNGVSPTSLQQPGSAAYAFQRGEFFIVLAAEHETRMEDSTADPNIKVALVRFSLNRIAKFHGDKSDRSIQPALRLIDQDRQRMVHYLTHYTFEELKTKGRVVDSNDLSAFLKISKTRLIGSKSTRVNLYFFKGIDELLLLRLRSLTDFYLKDPSLELMSTEKQNVVLNGPFLKGAQVYADGLRKQEDSRGLDDLLKTFDTLREIHSKLASRILFDAWVSGQEIDVYNRTAVANFFEIKPDGLVYYESQQGWRWLYREFSDIHVEFERLAQVMLGKPDLSKQQRELLESLFFLKARDTFRTSDVAKKLIEQQSVRFKEFVFEKLQKRFLDRGIFPSTKALHAEVSNMIGLGFDKFLGQGEDSLFANYDNFKNWLISRLKVEEQKITHSDVVLTEGEKSRLATYRALLGGRSDDSLRPVTGPCEKVKQRSGKAAPPPS